MFIGPHGASGDERKVAAAPLSHWAPFEWISGCLASLADRGKESRCVQAGAPAGGILARSGGGMGMLSLVALIFSDLRQAYAADSDVTFLDDDGITYKDLAHGAFELVTKEAIPRHILVEDPGQTIVLHPRGSSVIVSQVTNSATQMEELQAAQQEVLANFAKGLGRTGSGTTPFANELLSPEPINFVQPDAPTPQNSLPPIPSILTVPEFVSPVVRSLTASALPIENDTAVFDHFTPTSGTFTANGFNSGSPLTFGISGETIRSTVLDGATFDVSETGPYGTLYLNSTTGAYTFVPDNNAINALNTTTTESFDVTVSDGTFSASLIFTITINGVHDAAIISGTATGSVVEAGGVANAVPGVPTATGRLTDTDVDNPPNTFTPVSSPTPSAGGYGVFTMTTDGVWTYTLNNANSAVQALNVGGTLTDTFTVTTIDGTAKVVTIIINGANDSPTAHDDVLPAPGPGQANVSQGSTLTIAASTLLANDTDPDTGDHLTIVSVSGNSADGAAVTLSGADVIYDPTNAVALQALRAGQTTTDSFTYTIDDSHGATATATVTLVVAGINDVPVITSETDPAAQAVIVNPVVLAQGVNTNSLGLSTETFDNLPAGSDAFHGNFHSAALDATFSGSGNAGVINGSIPGVSVALFLGPLPGSEDTTNYLSISAGGTETITFGSEKNTFGLYWGTIDLVNTISFYEGATLVVSYTGAEVSQLLSANQGVFTSNGYLEFVGIHPFDRVVLDTGNTNAFELDNVSAGFVPGHHAKLAAPISGTLSVHDADIGDTLTGSVTGNATIEFTGSNGSTTLPPGANVAALVDASDIAFDTVQTNGGTQILHWTYNPVDPDLDFLKAGDKLTIQFAAQVNDGHGNVGSQPLTISIVGADTSENMSDLSVVSGTAADETFHNVGNGVTIFGGGGADNFVFNAGFGAATIGDFNVTNDKIEISHSLFSSIAEILAAATDSGVNTIITAPTTHDTITLKGVSAANLQAFDFHLF
jgi:VCBS repeat-containing protein